MQPITFHLAGVAWQPRLDGIAIANAERDGIRFFNVISQIEQAVKLHTTEDENGVRQCDGAAVAAAIPIGECLEMLWHCCAWQAAQKRTRSHTKQTFLAAIKTMDQIMDAVTVLQEAVGAASEIETGSGGGAGEDPGPLPASATSTSAP